MGHKMRAVLLGLSIAVPFFVLAGFLCVGLAQWSSYDFGFMIIVATGAIVLEWWMLIMQE